MKVNLLLQVIMYSVINGGKSMSKNTISANEKKWREESDARTLIEAEAIRLDKKRLSTAIKVAKSLADKKQKEAQAARKVARIKHKK